MTTGSVYLSFLNRIMALQKEPGSLMFCEGLRRRDYQLESNRYDRNTSINERVRAK